MSSDEIDLEIRAAYAFLVLVPQNRMREGLQEFRRALDLDPLSQIINTNYAVALMIDRQYDLAAVQFKHAQEIDQTLPF